jgi:hypothetical protein
MRPILSKPSEELVLFLVASIVAALVAVIVG